MGARDSFSAAASIYSGTNLSLKEPIEWQKILNVSNPHSQAPNASKTPRNGSHQNQFVVFSFYFKVAVKGKSTQ